MPGRLVKKFIIILDIFYRISFSIPRFSKMSMIYFWWIDGWDGKILLQFEPPPLSFIGDTFLTGHGNTDTSEVQCSSLHIDTVDYKRVLAGFLFDISYHYLIFIIYYISHSQATRMATQWKFHAFIIYIVRLICLGHAISRLIGHNISNFIC